MVYEVILPLAESEVLTVPPYRGVSWVLGLSELSGGRLGWEDRGL